MTGSALIIVERFDPVAEELEEIRQRLGNLRPGLEIIGSAVRNSVVRNFEKGGRPASWQPLSPVTLARRKGHRPLVRQGFAGGLLGSISWHADDHQVEVGTNKIYAAVHQFGAKKGSFGTFTVRVPAHKRRVKTKGRQRVITVKPHTRITALPWGDIPARPFLLVQEADWEEIRALLNLWLIEGHRPRRG